MDCGSSTRGIAPQEETAIDDTPHITQLTPFAWEGARCSLCDTSGVFDQDQIAVCKEYGREFVPSPPDSKVGVALQTLGQTPIHGLRHPPTGETNGWYIWAGEYSSEKDFFQPLHASHLVQQLPEVVRFLGLPPGSRFLLAGERLDVWFDAALLDV